MNSPQLTRREWLAATAMAAASAAFAGKARAQLKRPPVVIFSKHLQFLDYKALARETKALGLDGVDLTVRRGGHVLPENVATDLPKAVDAIRGEGLEVPMMTTNLHEADDADADPILREGGKLGIGYARINGHRYDSDTAPLDTLKSVAQDLAWLAARCERHGVTAGYHNHSGHGYVGAPLWDLHRVFNEVGSPNLGANFDIGHATVEGGYGAGKLNARLLAPHTKMMAVKDFVWTDEERPQWVPLGEGRVPMTEYFRIMRAAEFTGPISIHIEYDVTREKLLDHIHSAGERVRHSLTEAGYAAA